MKKLFALLLAVVLVLGMVACAQPADPTVNKNPTENNGTEGTNGTTAAPTTTESNVSVTFPLAEEITLKYLTPFSATFKDFKKSLEANKLWQELYQKTNIKIEIVECPDMETLNGFMQTDSYGDIIGIVGVRDLENEEGPLNQLVATGKLLDVSEYANNPKVMPNLHKYALSELPTLLGQWTSPSGGLYILGSYDADRATYIESPCWINKTWLDMADMTVEDVSTYEGLEEFFEWIMENDPNGNEEEDELPYYCYPDSGTTIEALLGSFGMPTKEGSLENYITIEDGEVIFVPQTDAYKDWLEMLRKWYANEWMWQDYFQGGGDYWYQKARETYWYNNGQPDRVGFYTANYMIERAAMTGAADKHPDPANKCEYIQILPPKMEGYETQWYIHPGFLGVKGQIAVAANTKYPAECCAWIDLFYNETITNDRDYGSEGSAWRTVEDGKIKATVLTSEQQADLNNNKLDTKLGTLLRSTPSAITNNSLENLRVTSAEVQNKRNALKMYDDAGIMNPVEEVWPRPWYTDDDTRELSEIRNDIFSVVKIYRAAAVTGKKNLTSDWDKFQNELLEKVETERFIEILQGALDNYLEGAGF